MMDLSNFETLKTARTSAQEVESDRREKMMEVAVFLSVDGGQWEDDVGRLFDDYRRPKYTFDKVNPIVAAIWGELADNEFSIRVTPAGKGADEDTAKTYAGLIRGIEQRSNARTVYSHCAKAAIKTGFACWRLEQDWADVDSFDQDLFIRPIHDAIDRVWFLGNYQEQTAEDADGVIIEHTVSEAEADEIKTVDRSIVGLGCTNASETFNYKREGKRIGELIYKKPVTKTLYQSPNGEIFGEDDIEEIKAAGVDASEWRSRKRETFKVCVRYFDAEGFITDEEETVFDHLPVIPVLPNFEILQNKPLSRGAIELLMDEQRVLNYAVSRKVEDTALSPKPKLMTTAEQVAGYERKLATMNNNNDPAFVYKHVEGHPAPYYPQVPGHNQGLSEVIGLAGQGIEESAGLFGPNLAKNEGVQSGVAIAKQQHKGDLGTIEYFKAVEVAIAQTGKVIVHALPKVYDEEREAMMIAEDGDSSTVKLYERIQGPNGEAIVLNDLSKGIYDVTCDIGPGFASRRDQTAEQLAVFGQLDPTIIQQNKDLLLASQELPGMKDAAERARWQLLQAGQIPESQWTEQEREQIERARLQAQQNPPPPDPAQIIAQAEATKAQAEAQRAQADYESKKVQTQLEIAKLRQSQDNDNFDHAERELKLMREQFEQQQNSQKEYFENIKTMAETLKTIKEAVGADAMVTRPAVESYAQQAEMIDQAQEQI
ncbi:portal protein [Gilvimarinus chinensis]|uniref:portal protein n=1 Tax=Gilvimarinus chinensis TaxID=396005 RepID=UPI000372D33D|nr:portal protein [Gilvimarinus chinensis]